jgi:hypothetical protein
MEEIKFAVTQETGVWVGTIFTLDAVNSILRGTMKSAGLFWVLGSLERSPAAPAANEKQFLNITAQAIDNLVAPKICCRSCLTGGHSRYHVPEMAKGRNAHNPMVIHAQQHLHPGWSVLAGETNAFCDCCNAPRLDDESNNEPDQAEAKPLKMTKCRDCSFALCASCEDALSRQFECESCARKRLSELNGPGPELIALSYSCSGWLQFPFLAFCIKTYGSSTLFVAQTSLAVATILSVAFRGSNDAASEFQWCFPVLLIVGLIAGRLYFGSTMWYLKMWCLLPFVSSYNLRIYVSYVCMHVFCFVNALVNAFPRSSLCDSSALDFLSYHVHKFLELIFQQQIT